MKIKYDNSERLETVSDKQWREALDHLTAYLRWRLKGRTRRGAHSEKALGMPAIEYYEEMAVVKLIEGASGSGRSDSAWPSSWRRSPPTW